MGPSNHAVVAALGLVLAGCSILTDTSDLTFGQASSVTASSTGGSSTMASTVATGGGTASAGGSAGMGGCSGTSSPNAKRVFATSETYQGNLDLLGPSISYDDAAAECLRLANLACLGGTWAAWISGDAKEPEGNFTRATVPYVNMIGNVIAANYSEFASNTHQAPINLDEYGVPAPAAYAWTGTNPSGTGAAPYCDGPLNWESSDLSAQGVVGVVSATGVTWSNTRPMSCAEEFVLYCVEQ